MTNAEADTFPQQKDDQTRQVVAAARSRCVNRNLRILFSVIILTLLVYLYWPGQVTQESLNQVCAALPTWLFLSVYLVLPLFGFPISVLLLASGLKYGFVLSVMIASVGMAFHTFAAWHIAHGSLRQRLEAWLSHTRFDLPTIPNRHQIWFTALFMTVPGLPYFVKLYSLALTNLPFRRYMFIVWFFHVLCSVMFIALGAAAGKVDWMLMIGLAVLAGLMVAISHWLKRLLEKRSIQEEKT